MPEMLLTVKQMIWQAKLLCYMQLILNLNFSSIIHWILFFVDITEMNNIPLSPLLSYLEKVLTLDNWLGIFAALDKDDWF